MHHEDVVVTVVDDNKKPYREHDFQKLGERTRRCKVVVPFDSEYKLLIKNKNSRRIKLEVEIDGTIVTNSGLIVDANQDAYLERFLNNPKKFKFVRPTSDGVADPTSVENGLVKVRVVKEKDAPYIMTRTVYVDRPNPWLGYNSNDIKYFHSQTMSGGLVMGDTTDSVKLRSFYCSTEQPLLGSVQDNSARSLMPPKDHLGDLGATVEGSHSSQMFVGTTWNGDYGDATIFTFQLLGMQPVDQKEYEEYLKLREKFEGK